MKFSYRSLTQYLTVRGTLPELGRHSLPRHDELLRHRLDGESRFGDLFQSSLEPHAPRRRRGHLRPVLQGLHHLPHLQKKQSMDESDRTMDGWGYFHGANFDWGVGRVKSNLLVVQRE